METRKIMARHQLNSRPGSKKLFEGGKEMKKNLMEIYAFELAGIPTQTGRKERVKELTQGMKNGEKGKVQKTLLDMAKTIDQKRKQRSERKPAPMTALKTRFKNFILEKASDEIERRRLQSNTWPYPDTIEHRVINEEGCFALVVKEGFYHYSRRYGDRFRRVCWLYGYTDGQRWVVRIPNTCISVEEALDWLKPEPVRKAEMNGRWVVRQGDIYLVELKSGKNNLGALLGTRHNWDEEKRVLTHPQHPPVYVPDYVKAVRAYSQSQIAAPGGRIAAD